MREVDRDLLDSLGYVCHDPDCTATHVDLDTLSDGPVFFENPLPDPPGLDLSTVQPMSKCDEHDA